jgi:hypothetical protein
MQRYTRRGLVVALTAMGLAACVDSLAPSEPRATHPSPTFSVSGIVDGAVICTPCPPGLICAAVCNSFPPIEVSVVGDTAGTGATVVLGPAPELRTAIAPADTAYR